MLLAFLVFGGSGRSLACRVIGAEFVGVAAPIFIGAQTPKMTPKAKDLRLPVSLVGTESFWESGTPKAKDLLSIPTESGRLPVR